MIRFTKVRDVKSPERGTSFSAGIDFFVPNDYDEKIILPREDILIPSGVRLEIPEHCALIGVDKSGISSSDIAKEHAGIKSKMNSIPTATIVGAKLIDADYPGEVHIHLINVGKREMLIRPGMKVAQFMLVPIFYDRIIEVPVSELRIPGGERAGGFSSTGI